MNKTETIHQFFSTISHSFPLPATVLKQNSSFNRYSYVKWEDWRSQWSVTMEHKIQLKIKLKRGDSDPLFITI